MSTKDRHKVCILGAPGSGKTCFLAGLAFLAESTQDNTYQIKGENGTPTQRWLSELARTIRDGDWPPSTTGTKFYDFDLLYKNTLLTLGMIDYAGDSLLEALGEMDQEQTAKIGEYFKSCKTLILLLDPQFDIVDHDSASHEAKNYSADRVNALLTTVLDSALSNSLTDMDIALVISKADTIEGKHDADAAKKMIENALPGFYQKLKDISRGKRLSHFFISSVGETETGDDGYFKPGMRLSPQGYGEIFTWIIKRRQEKRVKKTLGIWGKRTFLAIVVAVIIGVAAVCYYLHRTKFINDPSQPLEQKLEAANSLPFMRDEDKTVVASQTEQELSRIENGMAEATTEDQLQSLHDKLLRLKGTLDDSYQERVRQLENKLNASMEKMLVDKIQRYMDDSLWDDANNNIREYYNKFPNGSLNAEVDGMREAVYSEMDKLARTQVKDITWAGRSKDQWSRFLEDKAKAIEDYASKRDKTGPEKDDILKAASLARYISKHPTYQVMVKGAGRLKKDRETYLKIQIEDNDGFQTGSEDAANPSWNKTWDFQWKPGDKITIEWFRNEWYRGDLFSGDLIASITDNSFWSLQKLSNSVTLNVDNDWSGDVIIPIAVEFELRGMGSDSRVFEVNDWSLLNKYIHPGNYWD